MRPFSFISTVLIINSTAAQPQVKFPKFFTGLNKPLIYLEVALVVFPTAMRVYGHRVKLFLPAVQ